MVRQAQRNYRTKEERDEAQKNFFNDLQDCSMNIRDSFIDHEHSGPLDEALDKAHKKFLDQTDDVIKFHKEVFVRDMEKKYNSFASYEGRLFQPRDLEKEMIKTSSEIREAADKLFSLPTESLESYSPFTPEKRNIFRKY